MNIWKLVSEQIRATEQHATMMQKLAAAVGADGMKEVHRLQKETHLSYSDIANYVFQYGKLPKNEQ